MSFTGYPFISGSKSRLWLPTLNTFMAWDQITWREPSHSMGLTCPTRSGRRGMQPTPSIEEIQLRVVDMLFCHGPHSLEHLATGGDVCPHPFDPWKRVKTWLCWLAWNPNFFFLGGVLFGSAVGLIRKNHCCLWFCLVWVGLGFFVFVFCAYC